MTIRVKAFQTPKNGSTSEECQDAVAWNEQKRNFAIADGVSDSAFQSLWADLLVNSFVTEVGAAPEFTKAWLTTWLRNEQNKWNNQVNWDTVPWHGRMKAKCWPGLQIRSGLTRSKSCRQNLHAQSPTQREPRSYPI